MEDHRSVTQSLPTPPPRLFERLAQLSGYTWDQSHQPVHSSYDNWHVFGIYHLRKEASRPTASVASTQTSPQISKFPIRHHGTSISEATSDVSTFKDESERTYIPVVARVSTHALRLEREYHLCKTLIQDADPEAIHSVKPVELVKLSSQQGDDGPVVVSIFESPGRNYLRDLVDFGPALLEQRYPKLQETDDELSGPKRLVSLPMFLDFAIGASECLELLHHGMQVIHGEIRPDAFHFNQDTSVVKLINFGAGPRSFENGLTSAGWLTLSREVGIKNKLQFIAPEQTGRLPAEPDSRTDIYSLGVLFWTMLTQEPAFHGQTPIDIIQSVLSRRISPVATKRLDVPDIVSSVIQKMTQKQIDERYHSMSGLKYDLLEIQNKLIRGDGKALQEFKIGTRDVSSFFILPTARFGGTKLQQKIVKIIVKVAKQQTKTTVYGSTVNNGYALGSILSVSQGRRQSPEDTQSDASSQLAEESRSNHAISIPNPPFLGSTQPLHHDTQNFLDSAQTTFSVSTVESFDSRDSDTISNAVENVLRANSNKTSVGSKFGSQPKQKAFGSNETTNGTFEGDGMSISSGGDVGIENPVGNQQHNHSVLPRRPESHEYRRKGRCEVITITGAAGSGKSSLIQSVQNEIRRLGYFASGKFDSAQRTPFGPVLHAMSSLFRQIFSESDVYTEYHNSLRLSIRAIWPSLCKLLDLPDKLIYDGGDPQQSKSGSGLAGGVQRKSLPADIHDNSSISMNSSISTGGQQSAKLFRGSASTQSLRFMTTFLEVLRILTSGKLICLCLDDLSFADPESIDLITSIVVGKLRIVLIISCRNADELPRKFRAVLDSKANVTRLQLNGMTEEEVVSYVAATFYRSKEYVFPLATVIMEKSRGNPFYVKQMLEVCHRKHCMWYSWKESIWEYDLDRVFTEFESEQYGEQLNTNFITKRLQEQLPPVARSILAWASLLGSTFSFACVQRLLSGEFDYAEDAQGLVKTTCADLFGTDFTNKAVDGLQACLQAHILVSGDNDDEFRFSNDRYILASTSLRECYNVEKMHFIVAQTLMKYFSLDDRTVYARARHVCQSANLIKSRILHRSRFRDLLLRAGKEAVNSGARSTGLYYFEGCLQLMQPNPWEDGSPDVYYEETLDTYTQAAELYWYQGQPTKALQLLSSTFKHARTASDKAPSWIIQSRLLAQRGELSAAFSALRSSLKELGLEFEEKASWEACDQDFTKLYGQIENAEVELLVESPLSEDVNVAAMGTILLEAVSAAYWSDSLLFYQIVIKMVEVHLRKGSFVQSGLGFTEFAAVGMSRFGYQSRRVYTIAFLLLRQYNDPYTLGRTLTISSLFVAHLLSPVRDHLAIYEEAIDNTLVTGDKLLFLIAIGGLSISKLYIGSDMADLESFCTYAPEDFGDWTSDIRGGLIIISVRQVAKALQGKTRLTSSRTVMSDEDHDSEQYIQSICSRVSNFQRPRDVYYSLKMIPLYLFGFYDEAVDLGNQLLLTIDDLWSIRNVPMILFYLSLSIIAKHRDSLVKEESPQGKQEILGKIMDFKEKIELWQAECNVNYLMWSLLIEAESCEVMGDYQAAIQAYEGAIDHAHIHSFALEGALALELQGTFFIRRGASRAARAILENSISAYSRIRATGKSEQLATKYDWVLRKRNSPRTVDVGIQAVLTIGDIANTQYRVAENERRETRNLGKETVGDRTEAWLQPREGTKHRGYGTDISGLDSLDVLDLQSLLEFNHVISSELQIDRLLSKLTEIILECAGADFAGVVIEGEGGSMCMAASGNQDGIVSEAVMLTNIESESMKQVIFYTLRFKETVFVQDILLDERFSPNATSSKAVMSLPILQADQFLGVLYLDGQANSFTTRHLGVLGLFCNQVGISLSNALLFKRVKKVSASNSSMVESQKRALQKAIEAENKAKSAESEALRSVREKEEAAKAKSMFLANVSHELRTPLNGINGMSELLKGTTLNPEQDGYADSIRVCADTLLTVINDILDFSKLEAGKMKLFSVPMNLRETITEVVRALSFTNLERGLHTVEDLDLDDNLLVMGDPVRLHQIFMNLLSNAYKFTKTGGTVTVMSRTEYEDDKSIQITCCIRDTGIGITQEQLSRLFQPFSQADSSTQRSYGGSGLGLSICKALVGVLNGKIWMESQINVGTSVNFTLTFPKTLREAGLSKTPLSAKDLDPMAKWSSDADYPLQLRNTSFIDLTQIPRDQIRICIAEDNPINQKIAVSFVAKLGFKPTAYNDGKAAVEGLRQNSREQKPFHLVLMDCQMPVLDGYDATRLIREDEDPAVRGVLIIAMTASAIKGDREKCLDCGMNNYLAKPVRATVLKTMLDEYLCQPSVVIPKLQETAKGMVTKVIEEAKASRNEKKKRPGIETRKSLRVSFDSSSKEKISPGTLDDSQVPVTLPIRQDSLSYTPIPLQPSNGPKKD